MSATSTIISILVALGAGGLGFLLRGAFVSSLAKREHQIEVAGQRKIDKINEKATEEHKRVESAREESRRDTPANAIRDLIEKGKISR